MGIAGVVILYHPNEEVFQNILSYLPYIEKLYLADNTEDNLSPLTIRLQKQNKIQLIYDGRNKGIATRLNEAAAMSINEGYNWLLTMDQDSRFEENNLQDYLLCAGSFLHKERTAMFGVEHENKTFINECASLEVVQLITSGSIVNLNLFTSIGGFDEALFIDEVDLEYCYRAISNGYKIIRFANVFMTHHLGNLSYHKSLKNLAITPRVLHSSVRLYYMVRNYLYVARKYGNQFAENDKYRREALLNRIKNNVLYGKERLKTVRYLIKALRDFNKKKFGKISP